MVSIGSLYHLIPKVFGREKMYSLGLINAHFWLATIGTVLYIASMWVNGITQGLMWRAAIGDRHADTDIRLPAVAIQQRLERSQQQGEGSSPLLLGHAPERLGQINIQFQDELGTTMALPNRARPVERQLQHRLLAAQQAGPVR